MTTRLRTFMKIQANPNLAILDFLENTEKMNDRMARRAVAETLQAVIDDFRKSVAELVRQLENSIPQIIDQTAKETENKIYSDVETFRGEKGDSIKGDKGELPTKQELISLIKPLIPEPTKGDIPTKKELLTIIKPLIPEIEDGKTPTKEELLSLITPLIPKVKDGKDFPPEKIKEIFDKFEEIQKKIINLRQNIRGSKRGGGMGNVITEAPSGTVNGVNAAFTLTYAPKTNSLILLWQGQFQRPGSDKEYTLSGKTITFNTGSIPTSGELFVWYIR